MDLITITKLIKKRFIKTFININKYYFNNYNNN